MSRAPRIYVSGGEPAGDAPAAAVVTALKRRLPEASVEAFGGPGLEAAGAAVLDRMEHFSVVGFVEARWKLPAHLRLLGRVRLALRARRYDLVILVDYPGYHLRVAAEAAAAGIPVLYYIAPQMWAWAPGRVGKLAAVRRLAVILPFEEAFFRERGVAATFVGHPLKDRTPPPPRADARRRLGLDPARPVLGLFPGSRAQEVKRLWPAFRDAAARGPGECRAAVARSRQRSRPPPAGGSGPRATAAGAAGRGRPRGRARPGAGGVKLALVAGLVRVLAATWRYRVQGWEHVTAARASGRPVVYVLWHSRILPLLYHRRDESMALLISRHRDGGYLAELSERWGYRVVRGSSRRGGDVGLLGLVRYLRQGGEVALTPDGPRGPAERMKPGALAAAQHANALVIAAGARASSAWWIESWDRFCLPRPFARVDVMYSAPFGLEEGKEALRRGITVAEQALRAVTYGENR